MASKPLTQEQKDAAAKLNIRQLAFANLILKKPSHRRSDASSYTKAGYKPRNKKAAAANAARMIVSDNVAHYLKTMREESVKKTRLTLEELDKDLETSIFNNLITKIVISKDVDDGAGGKHRVLILKCPVEEIPDEVAREIQELRQTKDGIQVKMYSRYDARKLGYERLGGLVKKHEIISNSDLTPFSSITAGVDEHES